MAAANKGSKAKAGAVRFAPSQPSEGNPGHVHFDEKLRDSAVMVTQERDGHVLVKVLAGVWGAVLCCGVLAGEERGAGCPQGCTMEPQPLPSRNKGLRGATWSRVVRNPLWGRSSAVTQQWLWVLGVPRVPYARCPGPGGTVAALTLQGWCPHITQAEGCPLLSPRGSAPLPLGSLCGCWRFP
ncbi:UPF0687 protein C20orf27 homolog isoform X4 [Phasianus colchicus]|uniref:UPF0687 protein C20orf27 homolog isoform X4 n=1 Tax=Phasianus colchicus TaxID=9054 RepID=UPI00129E159F|nr:UPF0687 protein C20orf27 homolog isoform X4 [Phasianus colchicus]